MKSYNKNMERKSKTIRDYLTVGALVIAETIGSFLGTTKAYAEEKTHQLRKYELSDYILKKTTLELSNKVFKKYRRAANDELAILALSKVDITKATGEALFKHLCDKDDDNWKDGVENWELESVVAEQVGNDYYIKFKHTNNGSYKTRSVQISEALYQQLLKQFGEEQAGMAATPTPTPTPEPTRVVSVLTPSPTLTPEPTPAPTARPTIAPAPALSPPPGEGYKPLQGLEGGSIDKSATTSINRAARDARAEHIRDLQQNRRLLGILGGGGYLWWKKNQGDDDDDDDRTGHSGGIGGNNPVREGNR